MNDLASLLRRREHLTGGALPLLYSRPLHIVRANGVFMYDAEGRAYLDAYNNVAHLGHCHPAVVSALAEQSTILNTNCRYLDEGLVKYAERLTGMFDRSLDVCVFACSGSEANDLALRIAENYTGAKGVLVTANSYHGSTQATLEASGCRGAGPHTRMIPPPDEYRLQMTPDRYAAEIERGIAALRETGIAPKALLIDTQFVSDGIHSPRLPQLGTQIRQAGGLLIADEIQVGFGRLGRHTWGFEALGAEPDIVTLGKSIGNGYPLSAVVTRRAILESFDGPCLSTYGGSTVSCAAGLAVLDVLAREKLQENVLNVGAYLFSRLEELAPRHAIIGDLRGTGLLAGVELVRSRRQRDPAGQEAAAVVDRMREDGVLVGLTGRHRNVIKIRPPLVFAKENVDQLVETLDRALNALFA